MSNRSRQGKASAIAPIGNRWPSERYGRKGDSVRQRIQWLADNGLIGPSEIATEKGLGSWCSRLEGWSQSGLLPLLRVSEQERQQHYRVLLSEGIGKGRTANGAACVLAGTYHFCERERRVAREALDPSPNPGKNGRGREPSRVIPNNASAAEALEIVREQLISEASDLPSGAYLEGGGVAWECEDRKHQTRVARAEAILVNTQARDERGRPVGSYENGRLITYPNKRHCSWPGCDTILRRSQHGNLCSKHEDRALPPDVLQRKYYEAVTLGTARPDLLDGGGRRVVEAFHGAGSSELVESGALAYAPDAALAWIDEAPPEEILFAIGCVRLLLNGDSEIQHALRLHILAGADPEETAAMVLWSLRHRSPTRQEEDRKFDMQACQIAPLFWAVLPFWRATASGRDTHRQAVEALWAPETA